MLPPYPRIIAHRCGGALAPENTLPGLEIAARLGCRGVEFDVMLSADGVPLLMHDETVDRTTSGRGRVAELPAAQIHAFDAGIRHHRAYAGTPAPTLDEAMARCASLGLWANVEIKPATGHESITGRTIAERLRFDRLAGGVVSSFSAEALRAVRVLAPELPLALLFESLPANWRALATELGACAVHLAARHVDTGTAAEFNGFIWACYTVNSTDEADRLFALGCHAVFSDRPDLWMPAPLRSRHCG